MRPLVLACLLVGAGAGCLDAPSLEGSDSPGTWGLSGSFGEGYSDRDVQRVVGAIESRGGTAYVMESHPPQFSGRGFTSQAGCEKARETILEVPNLRSVGACQAERRTVLPDSPTSSG